MNAFIVARALRALPDDDLTLLAVHIELRTLPDDTLAGLLKHMVGDARQRVMAAIAEALLADMPAVAPVAPSPLPRAPVVVKRVPARVAGVKRTAGDMVSLMDSMVAYLRTVGASSQAGVGMEDLGDALTQETKDLALPMRRLIKEGRIGTYGAKRATKYFPLPLK